MYRNLDRRVELLFPVEDEQIRAELMTLLRFQLADTDKIRRLLGSGIYTRPSVQSYTAARSQANSYRYIKELAERDRRSATGEALKVFTAPEPQLHRPFADDREETRDAGEEER